MLLRIYKKNNINSLEDIDNIININKIIKQINSGIDDIITQIKIQRYLNLIKKTKNNLSEVYTEQTELIYENDDYIIVSYKKIIQQNELFPNLKVYNYDKNIEYYEIDIKKDKIDKINKIKLIKEVITFLEIDLDDELYDDFIKSYSIKTLLDQIKQQILNHI
jgi:hypothetical protein